MPVEFFSPTPWKRQTVQEANKLHNGSVEHQSVNKRDHYQANLHRLQNAKEQDLFKAARAEGFLHALTEDEMMGHSQNANNKRPSYPGDVRILSLPYRRLQDISLTDMCERLEICVLSNNFIQNIEPLKWCPNLYCLDVHSNQLNHIPGKKFWGSLPNLSIVYMHDNGMSRLEEVKYLSHSPSLCSLTLFDTPLSLKKNYRHCIVNAVWTLKSLDNYVISDEEIIEDAKFTERFKPCRKQFWYQSSFSCDKKRRATLSYDEANQLIRKELVKINQIQSQYCPVIIIQRVIRGFMVRLKYNYIKDTRLWAAVSIQRFYRDYKGYPNPPPTSPTLQYQDNLYQSLSSIRLDYETYLRLRRSRHKSTISVKSLPYRLQPAESQDKHLFNVSFGATPAVTSTIKPVHRHISVDLKKLEGQTTKILNQDSLKANSVKACPTQIMESIPEKQKQPLHDIIKELNVYTEIEPPAKAIPLNLPELADQLRLTALLKDGQLKALPQRIGKYYTQYAFLGEVDTNRIKSHELTEADDEHGTGFRLTIRRPDILTNDPLEELIMRTVEGADDIRQATREIDEMAKSAPLPSIRKQSGQLNRLQKTFLKSRTSMNFSAFRAVDKAYKDRDQAEILLKKAHRVRQIKNQESAARTKIKRTKRNYKNQACVKKHSDRVRVLEDLESRRRKLASLQDKTAAFKVALEESQQRARDSYQFSVNFRCQNASVGKALINHDHNKRKTKQIEEKTQLVEDLRMQQQNKIDLLRDYKDQKAIVRQGEASAAREEVDMKLLKNSAKRELELREHLKKHQEKQMRQLRSPTVLAVKELQSRDILISPDI